MDFKQFFQSLTDAKKQEFASQAGTTVNYIKTHLIYGRKVPQPKLLDRLHKACIAFDAGITRESLLAFFYPSQVTDEEAA